MFHCQTRMPVLRIFHVVSETYYCYYEGRCGRLILSGQTVSSEAQNITITIHVPVTLYSIINAYLSHIENLLLLATLTHSLNIHTKRSPHLFMLPGKCR